MARLIAGANPNVDGINQRWEKSIYEESLVNEKCVRRLLPCHNIFIRTHQIRSDMMRLAAGEFAKKCWPGLTMLMMSMILLLLVLEREIFLGQVLPVRKAASFLHTGSYSFFLHTTTHRSLEYTLEPPCCQLF